jgi:hypothetical protein
LSKKLFYSAQTSKRMERRVTQTSKRMERRVTQAIESKSFKLAVHRDDAAAYTTYLLTAGYSVHAIPGPGTGIDITFVVPANPIQRSDCIMTDNPSGCLPRSMITPTQK